MTISQTNKLLTSLNRWSKADTKSGCWSYSTKIRMRNSVHKYFHLLRKMFPFNMFSKKHPCREFDFATFLSFACLHRQINILYLKIREGDEKKYHWIEKEAHLCEKDCQQKRRLFGLMIKKKSKNMLYVCYMLFGYYKNTIHKWKIKEITYPHAHTSTHKNTLILLLQWVTLHNNERITHIGSNFHMNRVSL